MKNTKNFFSSIAVGFMLIGGTLSHKGHAQNIGINANGTTPDAKAILDIDATGLSPKRGLLVPRMTTTERNTITAPIPESLLIYNTTNQCFESWNQTTGAWVAFGCIGCTTPTVAPVASAATNTTTTGFTANWASVAGATAYLLDISTSSTFTSYVSGYNGLNVTNILANTVSSLTCATTYYYRVRATNACGTSANSNTITVTTSACPTSTAAACGTQVWMAANLNVGTMITGVTNQTNNSIAEKYCYNDVAANCTTYGGLYQWDEMMNYGATVNCDPCGSSGRQGLCPTGFHVPTDLEWARYEFCIDGGTPLNSFQTMVNYRGTNVGARLKANSSNTPAWDGTNASGFTAYFSGRWNAGGIFVDQGTHSYFWTATESTTPTYAWYRQLEGGNNLMYRNQFTLKTWGYSVRCLQD